MTWAKLINNICEEEGCCQVCSGKRFWVLFLLWTLWIECEARGVCWDRKTFAKEDIPSFPSWIHGQARGWIRQVFWLSCSTVGRNMVVPFVFPQVGSIMFLYSSLSELFYIWCNVFVRSELKWFPFLCLNARISYALYSLNMNWNYVPSLWII